jgi:hypothetical protein
VTIGGGARNWDVAPDGKHFVQVVGSIGDAEAGAGGQIHVVLNWFQELKARVPVK